MKKDIKRCAGCGKVTRNVYQQGKCKPCLSESLKRGTKTVDDHRP